MNDRPVYVTEKGKAGIEQDLHQLREVERPRIIDRLHEVKSGGDWMENTEQMMFEDELAFVDHRIQELEDMLADSQIIAWSCMHGGECLAVIILFRSKDEPFGDDLGSTIDVLRPIFAQQLANVITIHHRASQPWPQESEDTDYNDEYGFGFGGELAA